MKAATFFLVSFVLSACGVGYAPLIGTGELCREIDHAWAARVAECGGMWLGSDDECNRSTALTGITEKKVNACEVDMLTWPCERLAELPPLCRELFGR